MYHEYQSRSPDREPVVVSACQPDSPVVMQGPVAKYMSRAQGSPVLKGTSGQRADVEALGQAHINAVAGACLAIGIKFAGSGSAEAEQVLRHYVLYFLKAKLQDSDAGQGMTQP